VVDVRRVPRGSQAPDFMISVPIFDVCVLPARGLIVHQPKTYHSYMCGASCGVRFCDPYGIVTSRIYLCGKACSECNKHEQWPRGRG
jgi:hypothetical protein